MLLSVPAAYGYTGHVCTGGSTHCTGIKRQSIERISSRSPERKRMKHELTNVKLEFADDDYDECLCSEPAAGLPNEDPGGTPFCQKAEDNTPSSSSLVEDNVMGVQEIPYIPTRAVSIILSPEQRHVIRIVARGSNVFFTGSAGTGKSVLLREIIQRSRRDGYVAVTAATGIASLNIGGSTIHSWAGIRLGKGSTYKLVGRLLGVEWKRLAFEERIKMEYKSGTAHPNSGTFSQRMERWLRAKSASIQEDWKEVPHAVRRWRRVRTLVIDEVSMIDGDLFDKLEFIARILRGNNKPFGGIQLVISGDFCQLPPVPDSWNGRPVPVKFAFEADTWQRCMGRPVVLRHVFRQKDEAFVGMLNEMRMGSMSFETITAFQKLGRPIVYVDGIEPAELYPTKNEVEIANMSRLNELGSEPVPFCAIDLPGRDEDGRVISHKRMIACLDRLVALRSVTLKEGAQVMLIKNLEQGELVNGSLGCVIGFCTTREGLARGIQIAHTQIVASCNDDDDDDEEAAKAAKRRRWQRVSEEDKIPQRILDSHQAWPIVQFAYECVLCIPAIFEAINIDGRIEATREQVPLILAWALSIHKSQGQTLERVRVDLQHTFEKGQAYVAVSRATGIEGLEIRNFDSAKVQADQRVLDWVEEISKDDRTQSEIDQVEYWDVVDHMN